MAEAENLEQYTSDELNKGEIPQDIRDQMMAVLREYVNLGVIGRSYDNAGVPRAKHKIWMEKYPIYQERFNEIHEMFVDGLEMIAIQRAKEKSDSLLTLMLKSHRREVYGDKSEMNHTGIGNQIQLVFAEGMLTDEEKKLLNGGEYNVENGGGSVASGE